MKEIWRGIQNEISEGVAPIRLAVIQKDEARASKLASDSTSVGNVRKKARLSEDQFWLRFSSVVKASSWRFPGPSVLPTLRLRSWVTVSILLIVVISVATPGWHPLYKAGAHGSSSPRE